MSRKEDFFEQKRHHGYTAGNVLSDWTPKKNADDERAIMQWGQHH